VLCDVLLYMFDKRCRYLSMHNGLNFFYNSWVHGLLYDSLLSVSAWTSRRHLLVRVPLDNVHFRCFYLTMDDRLYLNDPFLARGLLYYSGVHVSLYNRWY
jgi:hypothetical protein